MNGICQNGDCPKLANLIARSRIGDRRYCTECFGNLHELMGDGRCTPLECHEKCDIRRLPAETFVPAWRQRSLARVFGEQPA